MVLMHVKYGLVQWMYCVSSIRVCICTKQGMEGGVRPCKLKSGMPDANSERNIAAPLQAQPYLVHLLAELQALLQGFKDRPSRGSDWPDGPACA